VKLGSKMKDKMDKQMNDWKDEEIIMEKELY
jgi:hypothetical protein